MVPGLGVCGTVVVFDFRTTSAFFSLGFHIHVLLEAERTLIRGSLIAGLPRRHVSIGNHGGTVRAAEPDGEV